MYILGIETSCDETAVAVVKADKNSPYVALLSNSIASSLTLHAKTGGIIPEIAAREQSTYMLKILDAALHQAQTTLDAIDAIAVTYGPGLIGSLLVGIETTRTIAAVLNKPVIPVNHLLGHIYANFIRINPTGKNKNIVFPAIALIVSGGHTDLLFMKDVQSVQWLGGTRDDAAGEAFDKIGRLLGLQYPAGAAIETLAKKGTAKKYLLPRPIQYSDDFDFSFSGLKTAALRLTQTKNILTEQDKADIALATQDAVSDVLVTKTMKAVKKYKAQAVLLGGGVAANQTLKTRLEQAATMYGLSGGVFSPEKSLCTDNGAMIAAAAHINFHPIPWEDITANPELYFD